MPPYLENQLVLIRGSDHDVSVFLGPKLIASHVRCWNTNKDIEGWTASSAPSMRASEITRSKCPDPNSG